MLAKITIVQIRIPPIMEEKIQMKYDILKENIKQKNKLLLIQLKIKLYDLERKEKVRLVAIFESGKEDRRIVCHTDLKWNENTKDFFVICQQKIELPYVFLYGAKEDTVRLRFEIERAYATTKLFPVYHYEASLFDRPKTEYSLLKNCIDNVAFAGCTLMLPLLLLDGVLATKGIRQLDTGDNTIKSGKKAIFFHANTIVKKACNRSYSPREWKTAYLNQCYEKEKLKPVIKNQVLFLSERKLEKNSNLDLIYQRFKQDSHIKTELYVNPKTVDKLSFSELRAIAKKMAQSSVIILEDFYPQIHFLTLRPETKLLQLWHACGAFKTFGFSRLGKIGGPRQNSLNHRSYDYAFVSSQKLEPIYAEAYAIPTKNMRAFGVPRTDFLFDNAKKEETKKRLYEQYEIPTDKKIILFAPTFRGHGNKDAFYPMENFQIDDFMKSLPEDTILLLKNHPFIRDKFTFSEQWKNRVLDFSDMPENINDLLLVTDLLITDYSSVIFEASLLNIPMLFYVFDKEEYLKDRDIYYDFDQFVPGPAIKTQKELQEYTAKILYDHSSGLNLNQFKAQYLESLDGKCTERIYSFIKTEILKLE